MLFPIKSCAELSDTVFLLPALHVLVTVHRRLLVRTYDCENGASINSKISVVSAGTSCSAMRLLIAISSASNCARRFHLTESFSRRRRFYQMLDYLAGSGFSTKGIHLSHIGFFLFIKDFGVAHSCSFSEWLEKKSVSKSKLGKLRMAVPRISKIASPLLQIKLHLSFRICVLSRFFKLAMGVRAALESDVSLAEGPQAQNMMAERGDRNLDGRLHPVYHISSVALAATSHLSMGDLSIGKRPA